MGEIQCQRCPIPSGWPQLTDEQWKRLAPLLPQGTGRHAGETRRQVNGMLYALESGCPWRLLPRQFGTPDAVEKRFRRWAANGVFRSAYATLYPADELSRGRTIIIDGSYAKAHPDAMGARLVQSVPDCSSSCLHQCPRLRPWDCPATEAIGNTDGGLNTNIVIAVNRNGQLVDWILLPGNAPESTAMELLLAGLRPALVVADAIHDNDEIREMLKQRNIDAAIANLPQRNPPYPRHPAIRSQHVADNYFAELKEFRRVATRYEKTAVSFDAVIALAVLWIALRKDYPARPGTAGQQSNSVPTRARDRKIAPECQNCPIPADWPQLTDERWERLAPQLPQASGLRAEETRRQVNGMLYVLESGCPWRLLPPQFGTPDAAEKRFRRWTAKAVFRRAYATLYPADGLSRGRTIIIGSDYAKVHKSAAGARLDRYRHCCGLWCPIKCPSKRPPDCPKRNAIAKTAGGFNTKIVIAVNEAGQLVEWRLLAGTAPEWHTLPDLLDGSLPAVVVANVTWDVESVRSSLRTRGIAGAIPNRPQRNPPYPSHPAIRLQHVADKCFAKLNHFRRVATRYEKTVESYDAVIALAALWIALQRDCP